MKTFYSAADIEALASQGVRELIVDDDTVLTSVAREAAAQLGLKLVAPGAAVSAATGQRATPAPASGTSFGKPRGCQHGPVSGASSSPAPTANRASGGSQNPVVDDLIGAVKQLAKRG